MSATPNPRRHWLVANASPHCICWAYFERLPNGRVEYLAVVGATGLLRSAPGGSEFERAAEAYRSLTAAGWQVRSDAEAIAAQMTPARLLDIAYD